jgi:hypothetical protein
MKKQLQQLEKSASTARQQVLAAEALLAKLQVEAKVAKNKSRHLKLEHRRARAAAKKAKHLALIAQEKVDQTTKLCAKATRRLEKARKKLGKGSASGRSPAPKPQRPVTAAKRQLAQPAPRLNSPKAIPQKVVPSSAPQTGAGI